jgi:tRNA-dihydrouridine synthase 1
MEAQGAATGLLPSNEVPQENGKRMKLHGRAFYESIGSPKLVLAPMVEQSEFVCLIITSVLPHSETMR